MGTIKTHLEHWLDFIGRDTKLKEFDRTDCEDYFYHRTKKSNAIIKQITIQNEQNTINTCIKYPLIQNSGHTLLREQRRLYKF